MKLMILILTAALLAPFTGGAAQNVDLDNLLAQGDEHYAQRADLDQARLAVELYRQAVELDPSSYEAAWRLSRGLYWVGDHVSENKAAYFEQAIDAGKKAVALNPDDAAGHYWLGVSYGLYAKVKGLAHSVFVIGPLKEHMAAVLKLDPGYDRGGAYFILGIVYYELPGVLGGDMDQAFKYLEKAVELDPQAYAIHAYLADAYIDQGRTDRARELVSEALSGTCRPGHEPECRRGKDQAAEVKERLESLKD